MVPHTRALIAAATYAVIAGKKVAGLYDHTQARDLQIAAECRGDRLQGFDGDRAARFGGTLPEIYDEGDKAHVSFEVADGKAQGYDRATSTAYVAQVAGLVVQIYDHGQGAWFAFEVREPDAA
jgi:hypothetical protein